ncbi:NAD-dependent epimerase/dehydratase family protein [Pseudodesulfovibrio pelocollis]|uniref:NAD-dependent epimerase/dehydratase family protein n=1 Tax=Pseudodesulfovibrio pelocollis TaxID=3051432 RepID=UPI00255AB21C|nr:NAD(P)-dependent oxidoreductase [Pseudodesulfovibrio sp. SB368]
MKKNRILIIGSSGLVGTALTSALLSKGNDVVCFDLRAQGEEQGDICDRDRVRDAVSGVDGIVHLAAVSRVLWGERDPDLCWATNVGGLSNVLYAAAQSVRKPWLIFTSSREVYGQPESLPVTEEAPLRPVNVYGRAKVEGERLVAEAQRAGIRACTIRLSNVFGSTCDHADRVVPAFTRAAALGTELRVDGRDHTFDFTHIDDVTRGIVALIELLGMGDSPPPPIHFVSGQPTTLWELANLAAQLGQQDSPIRLAAPRNFDVESFVGDSSRAKALLGWHPLVSLEEGISRLIQGFRDVRPTVKVREVAR